MLTKVGLDTFVDPRRQGCAMNASGAATPSYRSSKFDGEEWLYFPAIVPHVAIIRATTADERGNLTYEHEGAYLGGLEQALAARNNGGIVIAQVKRVVEERLAEAARRAHSGHARRSTSSSTPSRSRRRRRPTIRRSPAKSSGRCRRFRIRGVERPEGDRAPRRAWNCTAACAVNLGFGISANVPRILLEEGQHGEVTWVIEQGAVGGVPLLDFAFGCSSNADAIMPSP